MPQQISHHMGQHQQFDLDEIPFEASFGNENGQNRSLEGDIGMQRGGSGSGNGNHHHHHQNDLARMMGSHIPMPVPMPSHLPDPDHSVSSSQFNFPDTFGDRFTRPFDNVSVASESLLAYLTQKSLFHIPTFCVDLFLFKEHESEIALSGPVSLENE